MPGNSQKKLIRPVKGKIIIRFDISLLLFIIKTPVSLF